MAEKVKREDFAASAYLFGSVAFIIGAGLVWGPGAMVASFGVSAMALAAIVALEPKSPPAPPPDREEKE